MGRWIKSYELYKESQKLCKRIVGESILIYFSKNEMGKISRSAALSTRFVGKSYATRFCIDTARFDISGGHSGNGILFTQADIGHAAWDSWEKLAVCFCWFFIPRIWNCGLCGEFYHWNHFPVLSVWNVDGLRWVLDASRPSKSIWVLAAPQEEVGKGFWETFWPYLNDQRTSPKEFPRHSRKSTDSVREWVPSWTKELRRCVP